MKTWYRLLFVQKQIKSQLTKTNPELLQDTFRNGIYISEWN